MVCIIANIITMAMAYEANPNSY